MSRWKAASIHFGISIVIAILVFSTVFLLWYPPPYFRAAGAEYLWFVLVAVDLVIGPLLTLVVYKAGKPGLKFDLVCIAVAQVAALAYGLSVMAQARPVFLVFAVDRFNVVPANYIQRDSLQKASGTYRRLSWTGPKLVAAQLPKDRAAAQELMLAALSGADVETRPEYYVPYSEQRVQVLRRGQPLARLLAFHEENADLLRRQIVGHKRDPESVLFLPMTATRQDMAMVVDAQTAELVTVLPVNPWLPKSFDGSPAAAKPESNEAPGADQ